MIECAQALCGVWCSVICAPILFFIEEGDDVSDLTVVWKGFVFQKVLEVVFKHVLDCLPAFWVIHVIKSFCRQ
jgi:hypothetical protein